METEKNEKQRSMIANKTSVRGSEMFLRFLALISTLIAAIVAGVDKQTKIVPLQFVSSLPPVYLPATAKFNYMSAMVYFVVANSLACLYAAASLLLSLADMTAKKGLSFIIIFLDLAMVALLFSGNGAAIAVGVLGYFGNSHVQWNKVCNVFGKYCKHMAAALALSLFGSVAFFLLVLVVVFNLHKKIK